MTQILSYKQCNLGSILKTIFTDMPGSSLILIRQWVLLSTMKLGLLILSGLPTVMKTIRVILEIPAEFFFLGLFGGSETDELSLGLAGRSRISRCNKGLRSCILDIAAFIGVSFGEDMVFERSPCLPSLLDLMRELIELVIKSNFTLPELYSFVPLIPLFYIILGYLKIVLPLLFSWNREVLTIAQPRTALYHRSNQPSFMRYTQIEGSCR